MSDNAPYSKLDAFRPRAVLEGLLGSIGLPSAPLASISQPHPLGEQETSCGLSSDPNVRYGYVSSTSAVPSLRGATGNGNDSERSLCGQLLSEAQTRVLSLSEQRVSHYSGLLFASNV